MAVTAQAMLDSVESAILALTEKRVFSYTVAGRTYTAHDLGRLTAWRNQLKAEIAAGTTNGSRIGLVTFGGTT